MNREAQIKSIAEDSKLSINNRIEKILSVHEEVDSDTDEYYVLGCTVFETIRALLLSDNYEDCRLDDLLMCNCMLAEAYKHTSQSWRIAPLAQEVYDKLIGSLSSKTERLHTHVQVLGRVCECLRGTGHSRLMMRLLGMQLRYEKSLPDPDQEELDEIADTLYRLSLLTKCDTWLKPIEADVAALLGDEKMEAIKQKPAIGLLAVDPVEYTEQWENIIDEVEARVGKELADEPREMGFCFTYWHVKAGILQEYGIEWRSPTLMNPRVMFD